MKKTILFTLSVLVEAEESDLFRTGLTELDAKFGKIENGIDKILEVNEDSNLGWQSTSSLILDQDSMNCGRCEICQTWITDREKSDSLKGLTMGVKFNNQFLCDDHLPEDHPWAF